MEKKTIGGILLILTGIVLGFYFCVYIGVIIGIVDAVNLLRSTPVSAGDVIWLIAKHILATLGGAISSVMCIFGGCFLLGKKFWK